MATVKMMMVMDWTVNNWSREDQSVKILRVCASVCVYAASMFICVCASIYLVFPNSFVICGHVCTV